MPYTNAQHIPKAPLNVSAWADANGSIKAGSFSPSPSINSGIKKGTHSIVLPAGGFGADYEARWTGTMYRSDGIVSVPAGSMAFVLWDSYCDSNSPQMSICRPELYNGGTQQFQQTHYFGQSKTREWVTHCLPIQMPEAGSLYIANGLKIGFQPGFRNVSGPAGAPNTSPGNVYIDNIRVLSYAPETPGGAFWYETGTPARRAFDSGNGEIIINTHGAWSLYGVPYVKTAMYPDWDNGTTASYQKGFDNGFNTAYQVNPLAGHQNTVPSGMYISADGSSFIRGDFTNSKGEYVPAGVGWHDSANALQKYKQLIDDVGDRWISVYLDVEEYVWEEFEWVKELVRVVRQAESEKGTHKRPIFVHCQQSSGAERYHEIVDFIEFKLNPPQASYGTINSKAGYYDRLQGASGYGLMGHPDITCPHSTFSFNTPHNGLRLSGDLIHGLILGGAGFSIWSDRNDWVFDGVNRGFDDQTWWRNSEDVRQVLAAFKNLWPMMAADQKNELIATYSSNADDGWVGVAKTLRVVGNEIWGAFVNRDESQSKTIAVTTSENIDAGSLVDKFNIGSSAQITGTNTLSVTLAPGAGYVGAFTVNGSVVEPVVYDLQILAPAGGTLANPETIPAGTAGVKFDFSIDTLQGVAKQEVKFEQVAEGGSLTELNRQVLTPGGAIWDATPTISYIPGMLLKVTFKAFSANGATLGSATPQYYLVTDSGSVNVTPRDCTKTQQWTPDPIVIPRSCFFGGLTDAEAENATFSITNALPAGSIVAFDSLGTLTYTPGPSNEPSDCQSTSVVVLVNVVPGS